MSLLDDQLNLARDFWLKLKPVGWLALTIAVCQIVGLAVGLFIAPIGFPAIDMWYGAAFASPLGFVVGAIIQSVKNPGAMSRSKGMVAILVVACAALPLFGMATFGLWEREFGY